MDDEASNVARDPRARDESCARIKAPAAPREAVGATRRGARCAGRVAAMRAHRARRDARTEAGARTAAGARTDMASAIANADPLGQLADLDCGSTNGGQTQCPYVHTYL